MKHIGMRYHWLHSTIEDQLLKLKKIHMDDNVANMLTKVVPKEKLELYAKVVGLDAN